MTLYAVTQEPPVPCNTGIAISTRILALIIHFTDGYSPIKRASDDYCIQIVPALVQAATRLSCTANPKENKPANPAEPAKPAKPEILFSIILGKRSSLPSGAGSCNANTRLV